MDEEQRKKRERMLRKLDPNNSPMIKHLRNMDRLTQLSGAAGIIQDIEARQNWFYNSGIASSIENVSRIAEPNRALLDSINNMSQISIIPDILVNNPIFKPSPAMEAWQSSMERMSRAFSTNYNDILAGSINNLVSKMGTINYDTIVNFPTTLEISSYVERLNEAIAGIEIEELTEELEEQVDLQEVKSIMDSKISDILKVDTEDENFISYAMDDLLGQIAQIGIVGQVTVNDKLMINILVQTMVWFTLMGLRYNISLAAKSYTGNKNKLEAIKKEFKIMNFDETTYNVVRVVPTDDLEVLYLNKINSEAKYKLDMGELIMVEEEVGAWTKISYIDIYVKKMETGWVLTRYIKRLD